MAEDSYARLAGTAKTMATLSHFRGVIRLFGEPGRSLARKLDRAMLLERQINEFLSYRDRFNSLFRERGWIAYEMLDVSIMKEAISLGESGQIEAAELVLTEFYDTEKIGARLNWMRAVNAFRPREHLLQLAATDYAEGRFHACVPVVLAQIDGMMRDIAGQDFYQNYVGKKKKLLVAWDSISARPDGLPVIATLLNENRRNTTVSPIDIPYRNGILHGRDLGYANKTVAAKCWATLFALRDWAMKAEQGRMEEPPAEPQPSVREILTHMVAVNRQKKAIAAWRPRTFPDGSFPRGCGDLPGESPERAAGEFTKAWADRDFDRMVAWIQNSMRRLLSNLPQVLEASFGFKKVSAFQVVHIQDVSPAMSIVKVLVQYDVGATSNVNRIVSMNVVYESTDGSPLVRGTEGGSWGVNHVSALREEDYESASDDSTKTTIPQQ